MRLYFIFGLAMCGFLAYADHIGWQPATDFFLTTTWDPKGDAPGAVFHK